MPAVRDSEICMVTAVHGRDPAKVRQLARDFGVAHHYTDLARMIADGGFDIAIVCSPPFMHREQVEALAIAGIPTLCEKPLALSEKDALSIREMARRTGTLVMVAHQLRHQNTYAAIRTAIAGGEIGEPRSAFMEWSFAMDAEAPNARWKLDPALNGASSLADAGVHCLDLAIGLFGPGIIVGASSPGRGPGRVFEACDVLSLHGNVQVVTRVSRLYGPFSNQLLISGTRGEVHAPLFFTETSAPLVRIVAGKGRRTIRLTPGDRYRQEVEDFATMVQDPGFRSPGTSLDEAVVACRMMDAAHAMVGRDT
jgi:1,5-anhydro-D-fructose reductase (1,5-anhydro-D-mannitol-forming)